MGSKIRAVSREINLQHCREPQSYFISSAAGTSAATITASFAQHTHADINKTHMLHKISLRTLRRDVVESQRG